MDLLGEVEGVPDFPAWSAADESLAFGNGEDYLSLDYVLVFGLCEDFVYSIRKFVTVMDEV